MSKGLPRLPKLPTGSESETLVLVQSWREDKGVALTLSIVNPEISETEDGVLAATVRMTSRGGLELIDDIALHILEPGNKCDS